MIVRPPRAHQLYTVYLSWVLSRLIIHYICFVFNVDIDFFVYQFSTERNTSLRATDFWPHVHFSSGDDDHPANLGMMCDPKN